MPDSHNRHGQSPLQWICVQLKQHRQWPENDGNWKTSAHPQRRLPSEDQIRSETEKFLVRPVEVRTQLAVLLEIPGLPWLKTNQNYVQKTGQNLDFAQEIMKVPHLPKKRSKQREMGKKSGYFLI